MLSEIILFASGIAESGFISISVPLSGCSGGVGAGASISGGLVGATGSIKSTVVSSGITGATGSVGSVGAVGSTGGTGATGSVGATGATGATGSSVIVGLSGSEGLLYSSKSNWY